MGSLRNVYKECLHNAVKINIFGLSGHGTNLPLPPQKKIIQGRRYLWMTQFPSTICFAPSRSWVSRFQWPRILVCFHGKFDLLFTFGTLSCWILDYASLFILCVHKHNRLGFGMLTMETAVFDFICWFTCASCNRQGQSYPVKYCLGSVEEYSEGKIHKSEPEPGNGICEYCLLYSSGQG